MKTIWKFEPVLEVSQAISMPAGAEILSVQVQNGEPCIWAKVDRDAPLVPRLIEIVGTGHYAPDHPYIGTVQTGEFVWHFFDLGEL